MVDNWDKKANVDNTESKPSSQTSQTKDEVAETVKRLRKIVERYFKVYDVKWDSHATAFFCTVYIETLESKFNDLRAEIDREGYVPLLRYEGGEHVIYVTNKPKLKFRSAKLNVILLIATILTTMFAGSEMYVGYESAPPVIDSIINPRYLFLGLLSFTVPLLFILGVHELSHYYMAKKHGIKASLPFFIPAPGMIGTYGAFINIREPIPNRKALFDIGVAGPIASFLASIPVILIGLFFMNRYPAVFPESGGFAIIFGQSFGILPNITFPLLYTFLSYLVPTIEGVVIHPTAFAGWVGLLVTAMNLLPAGQLDGGHVASAVLGKKCKYASYAAIGFMLLLGLNYYNGWLIFALLIMFLGVSHPPPLDDVNPLGKKRKVIASFVCVILVLSFVPIPMVLEEVPPIDYSLRLELAKNETVADIDSVVNYTFVVNNTGNVKNTIKLNVSGYVLDVFNNTMEDIKNTNVTMNLLVDENKSGATSSNLTLDASERQNVTLSVSIPKDVTCYGKKMSVNVTGTSEKNPKKNHTITATIAVRSVVLYPAEQIHNISYTISPWTQYNITIRNIGKNNDTFNVSISNITPLINYSMIASWSATVGDTPENLTTIRNNMSISLDTNESGNLYVNASVSLNSSSMPQKEGVSLILTATSEKYNGSFDSIELSAVLRI